MRMRCVWFLSAVWLYGQASRAGELESWYEIRSRHFVMISNADEERAEAALTRLEQFRFALSQALPKHGLRGEVPTQVYGFRDFDSFESFLPPSEDGAAPVAGYFRESAFKNVIALDLTAGPFAYEPVIFHEYVHLLLSYGARAFPLWFEEGLAEFYASAELEADHIELGAARFGHRRTLRDRPLLSLEELLTRDAATEDRERFYAQSWLLVHYLVVERGDEGRKRLARYLAEARAGDDAMSAFLDVMEADAETLEHALTSYAKAGDFSRSRIRLPELSWREDFHTRRLSMAEVQHRWGELFLFTGRTKRAHLCLTTSVELDPVLGRAWETLGFAQLIAGNDAAAIPLLRTAAERGGASATGLYQYAHALVRERGVTEAARREAEAALRQSLELKPASPDAMRLLAFLHLVSGTRLTEATGLVESALEISPDDPKLLYLLGQLSYRQGEYERARAVLARVVESGEDDELSSAAKRLLDEMARSRRAPW